ncbi:MAG: glycosyltransferase family 4 protein [Candidatus Eisenbacteria bacterium]|nr:glycosyltransferase family 4 protein [Candidatus Eisenbacteria bacterium]
MGRSLRVGMLLDRTFPPDPRVSNEARSLAGAGYEVHILCLRHGREQPEIEDWRGITLHRLLMPRWFYRKASALSLDLPAYRWALRGALDSLMKRSGIEILHLHDLPMVAEGLRAGRKAGVPVVADLHENWPAALATYGYARRFPGRILISPSRWAEHERRALPHAERVIVVVEEARDRLIGMGIRSDRIEVVQNTVDEDEFDGFGIDPRIVERFAGRFVVSYLGGFERHRGIETAVRAMPALLRAVPDALLLLVGTGSTESQLRAEAERLGVARSVAFEGWQPFERFPSYISASAACLIPHLRNDHTDTTIPHKLFHYMLLGRPVLVSDCRPLRRIVEECRAGIVVPSGDPAALAEAAARLADPSARAALGEAGREAVRRKYNWSLDGGRLVALYRELERRR